MEKEEEEQSPPRALFDHDEYSDTMSQQDGGNQGGGQRRRKRIELLGEITHEGCYCKSFYKFHQKLVLKIPIFGLQGSVKIQCSIVQYSDIPVFKPQMENLP